MADVFISYKRENQIVAAAIDSALQDAGYTVWWDPSVRAGEYFDERIEAELINANAVITLWSEQAVQSQWVKAEAINAFGRGVLVSARIDDVKIGFPFNVVQAADLRGWNLSTAHPGLRDLIAGVAEKVGRLPRDKAKESDAPKRVVSAREASWKTGLRDLDALIGALGPGSLTVLASRPSMGKSALAANISLNIARQMQIGGSPLSIQFHSLELSGDDLGVRILSIVSGVSAHRLKIGKIDADEYQRLSDAAELLNELPLHVDESGNRSIDAIVNNTIAHAQERPTGLVVIDTFQLIQSSDSRDVARRLKGLAKELALPVVVTADVSRSADSRDNKRPTLLDISEALEEIADCVIGIYRERVYLERNEPTLGSEEFLIWRHRVDQCARIAELLVLKQRSGPTDFVSVGYLSDTMEFSNLPSCVAP